MRIKIEFEIELEDVEGHTEEQLEEFLRFEFGDNGHMSSLNPFYGKGSTDPIFGTFEWSYEE